MLSSLSHPRKRTISVGPQSQADVYEAIAVRERKRRDSEAAEQNLPSPAIDRHLLSATDGVTYVNGSYSPATLDQLATAIESEDEDEELFQRLSIPRVRYDVEVVTKLIVYAGESLHCAYTTAQRLTASRYCLDLHRS